MQQRMSYSVGTVRRVERRATPAAHFKVHARERFSATPEQQVVFANLLNFGRRINHKLVASRQTEEARIAANICANLSDSSVEWETWTDSDVESRQGDLQGVGDVERRQLVVVPWVVRLVVRDLCGIQFSCVANFEP